MNLEQLSSPLPKPWLSIQCDSLIADQIQTPVGFGQRNVFASRQGATVNITGVPYTAICGVGVVGNPGYTVGTNLYFAPTAQLVCANICGSVTMSAIAQTISWTVVFLVNGVELPTFTGYKGVASATFDGGFFSLTNVIPLAQGDTLGYRITSSSSAGGSTISATQFSGFVL